MKKNGFTMVELIASIGILSILFAIGSYALINSINKSKEEAYEVQISQLKDAVYNFIADQSGKIEQLDTPGQSYTITLQTLNDHGFIELPVTNPRHGEAFDPELLFFKITKQANSTYKIEISDVKAY